MLQATLGRCAIAPSFLWQAGVAHPILRASSASRQLRLILQTKISFPTHKKLQIQLPWPCQLGRCQLTVCNMMSHSCILSFVVILSTFLCSCSMVLYLLPVAFLYRLTFLLSHSFIDCPLSCRIPLSTALLPVAFLYRMFFFLSHSFIECPSSCRILFSTGNLPVEFLQSSSHYVPIIYLQVFGCPLRSVGNIRISFYNTVSIQDTLVLLRA